MLSGVANAVKVKTAHMGQPQAPQTWSTRKTQSTDPATMGECALSLFCLPCVSSMSKSRADKTHPLFNFLCFQPCMAYTYVRHLYNIGGPCGDDLAYGVLCTCCLVRQAATETRLRGAAPGSEGFGANVKEWDYSLFDCSCCELFRAICLMPCVAHSVHQNLQPKADSCCYDLLCLNPASMYGQVRNEYGIITDFPVCEDVCLPLVCAPCALNRAQKQSAKPRGGGYSNI